MYGKFEIPYSLQRGIIFERAGKFPGISGNLLDLSEYRYKARQNDHRRRESAASLARQTVFRFGDSRRHSPRALSKDSGRASRRRLKPTWATPLPQAGLQKRV